MLIFALILLGVLLNAAAQLMLKAGMTQIGQFEFSTQLYLIILIPIILFYFLLLRYFQLFSRGESFQKPKLNHLKKRIVLLLI